MDKSSKHIKDGRNASVLAIIISALGFLVSVFSADAFTIPFPSYVYVIDVVLLSVGLFGIIKQNIIAASVLLGYFLLSRVVLFIVVAQLAVIPIIINLYIVFSLGKAILAMSKIDKNVQ